VYGRQQRANPTVETQKYWRVTISIPLLDSIISELECHFSEDKMAHYVLFNLMPQAISANGDLQLSEDTIILVCGDLIPFRDILAIKLKCCKQNCSGTKCDKSITKILAQNADSAFFPDIRQLLCILAKLQVGSIEVERSFSCLKPIDSRN